MNKLEIKDVYKDKDKRPKPEKAEDKRPQGRPTKWEDDFPERLLAEMSKGLSFEACCGALGISKDTGYKFAKENPEFAEAKQLGESKGQYHWESEALKGLWGSKDEKFNATVYIFTMKNRFGWRDRKEISGDLSINGNAFSQVYKTWTDNQVHKEIDDILGRFGSVIPKGPTRT